MKNNKIKYLESNIAEIENKIYETVGDVRIHISFAHSPTNFIFWLVG
jgi:hypothetical protein